MTFWASMPHVSNVADVVHVLLNAPLDFLGKA